MKKRQGCPGHTRRTAACLTLHAASSLPHTGEFPGERQGFPAAELMGLCYISLSPHSEPAYEQPARSVTSRSNANASTPPSPRLCHAGVSEKEAKEHDEKKTSRYPCS